MSESEVDDLILRAAFRIADMVGVTLGPLCEVAVHDLRKPTHSLVHLVNGHITGRQLGSPIRDLIGRVLPNMDPQHGGFFNYLTVLGDGRRLKSSTTILRNDRGKPLVAFCINIDVTQLEAVAGTLAGLARLETEDDPGSLSATREAAQSDTGVNEVEGILRQLILNIARPAGRAPSTLSKGERMATVAFLEERGAFKIKGSIQMVASEVGTSEATIYRYLNEIRNGGPASPPPRRRRRQVTASVRTQPPGTAGGRSRNRRSLA
jgi:predicted transcriptional regulator YheO